MKQRSRGRSAEQGQSGRGSSRSRSPAASPLLPRLRLLLGLLVVGLVGAAAFLLVQLGLLPVPAGTARAAGGMTVVQPDGSVVTAVPGANGLGLPASVGDARKVAVRDVSARGSADAPVTMIEYADFQCGYCRKFWSETEPQITASYVAPGKVRFAYKHMAGNLGAFPA